MTTLDLFPKDITGNWEALDWRNATGVLTTAMPLEWQDVLGCLRAFRLSSQKIVAGGGKRSVLSGKFDKDLADRGWKETQLHTSFKVDETVRESPTHKVDTYKNGDGLELDWNNKDPFYDRDLNTNRLARLMPIIPDPERDMRSSGA